MIASPNAAMATSYDYGEVCRSVSIALLASYAALDLAGRVMAAAGRVRSVWLAGGATAMGIGIWSMHFNGMLAFRLPVPVSYHWPTVLLSLLLAISASAFALHTVSRPKLGLARASLGSILMGGGIAGMHYAGMAAMRLPAIMRFHPLVVVISIALAIVFSFAALMLAFDLREETRELPPRKIASTLVMGVAVCAMHYTGMASVSFMPSAVLPNMSQAGSVSSLANNGIAIVTVIVLSAVIFTSSADRQAAAELQLRNEELEHRVADRTRQLSAANKQLERLQDGLRSVIDTIPQQIWSGPPDGSIDFANERFRSYTGLSLEELRGQGWQNILHPDDWRRVLNAWQESLANGTPYEQEERHRGADGQYRWFLSRALPMRDAEGQILRWQGTNTDIEDRKWAEEELRALSGRLLQLQDEERRRIASELHDAVGQNLVALATALGQIRESIPASSRKLQNLVSESETLAEEVLGQLRTLSYMLYPPVLDQAGLEDALHDFVSGFIKRSGIDVELEISPNTERMTRDVELALFRVVQESLTNIQRHSGGHHAKIRIERTSQLTLEISDSGSGLLGNMPERADRSPFETGVGIKSMRERVNFVGGRLEIERSPGGTTVRVTIPLESPHEKTSNTVS